MDADRCHANAPGQTHCAGGKRQSRPRLYWMLSPWRAAQDRNQVFGSNHPLGWRQRNCASGHPCGWNRWRVSSAAIRIRLIMSWTGRRRKSSMSPTACLYVMGSGRWLGGLARKTLAGPERTVPGRQSPDGRPVGSRLRAPARRRPAPRITELLLVTTVPTMLSALGLYRSHVLAAGPELLSLTSEVLMEGLSVNLEESSRRRTRVAIPCGDSYMVDPKSVRRHNIKSPERTYICFGVYCIIWYPCYPNEERQA